MTGRVSFRSGFDSDLEERTRISESPQLPPLVDHTLSPAPPHPSTLRPPPSPVEDDLHVFPFAFSTLYLPSNDADTPPSASDSPVPNVKVEGRSSTSPEEATLLLGLATATASQTMQSKNCIAMDGYEKLISTEPPVAGPSKINFAVLIDNMAKSSSSSSTAGRGRKMTSKAIADLTADDSEESVPLAQRYRTASQTPRNSLGLEGDDTHRTSPQQSKKKAGKRKASEFLDFQSGPHPKRGSTSEHKSFGVSSTRQPQPAPVFKHQDGKIYSLQVTGCLSRLRSDGLQTIDKCHKCTSRQAGFQCAFQGHRWFQVSSTQSNTICSHEPAFFSSTELDEEPIFPDSYNEPFTLKHSDLIKTVAAHHLLATMEEELAHAKRPEAIRIRLELKVRSECDTCRHAILGGSWLCRRCAKELCYHCFEALRDVVRLADTPTVHETITGKPHEKRLKRCTKGRVHTPSSFLPSTRLDKDSLQTWVTEMKEWKATHRLPDPKQFSDEELKQYYPSVTPLDESHPTVHILAENLLSQHLAPSDSAIDFDFDETDEEKINSEQTMQVLEVKSSAKSPMELFHSLWSMGVPMVVDLNTGDTAKLDWSPEYFIREFGILPCSIVSNCTKVSVSSTVGEFFKEFGQARDHGDSLKIKDWPSTSDFKSEFPHLYENFMEMIPVGSVTRRDGIINIASHTPKNANPPDLGPKGYFSQTSDDSSGGSGSTVLHMDVADAVNIMMWAASCPDGTPGAAAWDLFRAEDADLIREFLFEQRAALSGKTVSEVKETQDDPIHDQATYLDRNMRQRLFEEKGVKSHRIWQRPGQCVFIPAGCAHQVCNFSDCIKIASDFVSIENVARCWKVTDEFRQQTKGSRLWRDDVLQLKTQLLWAWRACRRFEESAH